MLVLLLILGFHGIGLGEERYSVKSGDSLYTISKSFGVSVEAIKGTNKLRSNSLQPKQVLLIPTQNKRVPEEASQKPPVETEKYVVKKGETLHTISKGAGTSVEEIKKLNKLTSTALRIGQVLLLPRVEREEESEDDADVEETLSEPVAQKEEQNQEISVPGEKRNGSEEKNLLVRVVKTFLGVPYRLGGSTLKGIDCSAFVKKIYEIFNVHLPRTAREQFRFGKKVDKGQLEKGDLVFFKTRRGENTHVGIYIGNNEFVHASSQCKEVKVDNLEAPYFNQRFMKGVRVKEFEYETNL
jgi:cell wall-associated NlpC family hydrolase